MPTGDASELYRVGDLLVDVTGASVSRHGERIVLPPRTFELLVALVRHYPSTVRRPDLLDTVWPDETVSDQTLSHRVMVLRKALGDHAEEPAYVAGERGFGYRLLARVERLGPGEQDPKARAGVASRLLHARLTRVATAAAIGVALLSVALRTGDRAEPRLRSLPAPESVPLARVARLCLRGEFYFLTFTEEGLRRSAEAWEQALALEPGHARAHAGRALTEGVRALLDHVSPAASERSARDGARRAMELDPGCPAAHLAKSLVLLLFDWDAVVAAAAARGATTADRDDERGPIVLALALQANGWLEESEHVLEAATLDNPHCAAAAYLEGRSHEMRGRWAEAVADYSHALELEPDLALARLGSAECLSASGRRGPALATWRRLCVSGRATARTLRACVLGGEAERAERLLAEAVAARRPFVVLAPYEALLQPLRQGPAMRALVVRLQQHHPL